MFFVGLKFKIWRDTQMDIRVIRTIVLEGDIRDVEDALSKCYVSPEDPKTSVNLKIQETSRRFAVIEHIEDRIFRNLCEQHKPGPKGPETDPAFNANPFFRSK